MNSPSIPEPFITAKGSSCGLGDRIWGISSGGGADTPGERIKKEGGDWVFSPYLLPLLPLPCHLQASHPNPSPKAWPLQVSGNCSLPGSVDKQAGQGWVVPQTTDPRTSSQSWQKPSWAQGSRLGNPRSPWKLTPSWPAGDTVPGILEPSPLLSSMAFRGHSPEITKARPSCFLLACLWRKGERNQAYL
jgi:hypothetical protein